MDNVKWWLEAVTGLNKASSLGMSSGAGCTVDDLPTDVNPGSSAFDYTTKTVYFFDGISWS